MDISKIYNANVYIDGTNNLLGKAKEIEMPKVTSVFDEHTALGLIGKLMLPTGGIEELTAKIIWNGFYPDVIAKAANPFDARKLQVRASVDTHGINGRTTQEPLVTLLTARFKGADLGKFAQATNSEFENELTCSYVKTTLGSRVLLEVDVQSGIWIVDGKDLLQTWKKNLGL